MSSSDSLFHTLPTLLQKKIDNAFTSTATKHKRTLTRSSSQHVASTSTMAGGGFLPPSPGAGGFLVDDDIPSTSGLSGGGFLVDDPISSSSGGGGFLIDEPAPPTGGGFLIEEDTPHRTPSPPSSQPTQIPFSLIPAALQLLDLPPDDPEVLSVFQNAAGGWRSSNVHPLASSAGLEIAEEEGEGEWVSRDDWRAVCAVLLEGRDEEEEEGEDEGDEDVDMSDAYAEPDTASPLSDISSPEDSDDEFRLTSTRGTRRKPTRRTRGASASSPIPTSERAKPTPRQRQTALEAFSLFFPDLSDGENLPAQRIRVGEIQRAAGVLKEKIKAEEMVEMLSMFSTAPDKSVGLDDFTRMMIAAKLA
ncbi:hypothetical protein BJ912DRAFT_1055506 [Pholiota molesta]|nr:hypothetical protein BJ912DRAFT_1055506 [Pholiota molesta]